MFQANNSPHKLCPILSVNITAIIPTTTHSIVPRVYLDPGNINSYSNVGSASNLNTITNLTTNSSYFHWMPPGTYPDNITHHPDFYLYVPVPNNNDMELARCETVGILGTAAGLAGLLSAQKTINFLMQFNQNNNFLTLINCKSLSFNHIKIDKNPKCNLILSKK